MEQLLITAISLAKEVEAGQWGDIAQITQHPDNCRKLVTELQQRAPKYQLNDYIKALSYALSTTLRQNIKENA